VLLDESKDRVYVAQTGLIGGSFPTHKTVMTRAGERSPEGRRRTSWWCASSRPSKAASSWSRPTRSSAVRYDIAVKHEVVNTGSTAVSPQLYLQLVRDGNKPPGESSFYSTFTGPAVYTDAKKYQKVEFKTSKTARWTSTRSRPNGYVAMVQHYFASAWLLADGVKRENCSPARWTPTCMPWA
jgi:YidC/Oxa1 family membrane protein insertase